MVKNYYFNYFLPLFLRTLTLLRGTSAFVPLVERNSNLINNNLMTNNYKTWSARNLVPWLMCLLLFFGTGTVVQATTCPSATVINPASLPVGAAITCGAGNDITTATVAASALTGGCNSANYYGGQEALYSFTPTTSGGYDISIAGQTWTAIFVFNGCPTTPGTSCVGGVSSSTATKNVTVYMNGGTTYYIMFDTWPSPNSPCPGTFTMTAIPPSTATATAAGGLWSSPATWVGGVVPNISASVVIPAGSTVTVDQVTTFYDLSVSGSLVWNGTANAMTVLSNITVNAGGRFLPYTSATTPSGITVNVGGNFTNNGYVNFAAGTGTAAFLNFNGTGSTLSGSGYFEGDGTRGLIRQLFFQNNGANTISTTQSLVTHSFGHTSGSLNTNGKLTIDNAFGALGLAINRQVASVTVTAMGSGYTAAPIAACAGAGRWAASTAVSIGNVRVTATDIYLCTVAGTTAATEPTHTSGTASNGSATFLWVGTAGTIGQPFVTTTLTVGNLYFLGNNLYQAVATTATPAASAPTHTSSTVGSFRYVGSPAKVSVNWDAGSGAVRSLNLVTSGSGYTSSAQPAIVIVPNTAGSGAAASAVVLYSLQGRAAAGLMQKSPVASITGGMSFNSDGGASLLSADPQASAGISSVYTTAGGTNYTVAPVVGFAGPHTLNLVTNPGSGYTTAPTITVTGGNLVSGTALTSANFTITTNRGKVVSIYLNTGTTACYSTPPTLTISAPGAGTTATAAFPAGSWPAATANIDANGQLTFTVTNAGFGYQTTPTVGIGATSGTANGGTFTQAATTPVAIVGAYSLTLNFFSPASVNETQLDDASIIPANRKLSVLSINGNSNGMKLNGNLTLFGSAPFAIVSSGSTTTSTLGFTGNKLDLNGYNLFCSWNGYAGTTSAFNPTGSGNGYITNGSMTLVTRGGGTTGSTLNFPFRGTTTGGTFRVFTGTGASVADGADVLNVKVTELGAPTNATTGGTGIAIGNRSFNVQTTTTLSAAGTAGTNPTVQEHFNSVDGLTTTQNRTFLSEGTVSSGPWTIRSAAFGASGALPAAGGSITSATTAPGPIALPSNGYYAFATSSPVITSVTPLTVCASSGSITVTGTGFTSVSDVKVGGTSVSSFTIAGDTVINAILGTGTTGVVSVIVNGGAVSGIDVVTVNPAPGAPSVSPTSASIQVGQTTSFTASGTETIFNWYDAAVGGTLVYSGASFTTPAICSNTTYYVAQNNGSCDGPRVSVTITVPTLSITATPSNALICSVGGSVSLDVNSLPGLTYSWTGVGLDTYSGTSVVASPSVTTTYVVTASDGASCNITATVNVGVIAGSAISPTASPASTCYPGGSPTIQLNSNLSAGNFGVLSIPYAAAAEPGTGVTTIASNGVASVPLSGGSLDDGGWSGIPIGFSYNFFGSTFTTISAGTNGLLMFGTPPGYGTGAGQLGQYSFTTTPAVFPNASNPGNVIALMAADQYFGNNTAGSATSILKYWNDGIAPTRRFIIQYQTVNSCCLATNPTFTAQAILYETTGVVEIHIYDKNATSGSTVGLQDATKTIGAVAPGRQNFTTTITTPEAWRFIPPASYTYSWTPTTGLSNPTAGVTDYTVSGTGTFNYDLTVTNPTTGCQVSAPVSFVVNPLPAAPTVTPNTFSVSGGSPVSFTASGEVGATFNVYDAPTGGTLLFTGDTYTGAAPCADDTLWVDQNNGICTSGSRAMVVINVIPVTAPTTNPSTQCGPGIPSASVNAVPGAVSYSWYDAPTGGTLLQSSSSLTYTSGISATTTFYVSAFDGYCESARTSVVATVLPPPAILAVASDSSLCEGPSNLISLNEVYFINYPTYSWSVEPGGNLVISSGFSVTATPSAAGVYNYVVTGTDGFCTNSDTVTVVVGATPPAPVLTVSNDDICEGNTATLSVPVTSGSIVYCTPSLSTGCSFPDMITNVTIAGINRTSTCDNLSGANGYSLFTTPTGALVAGSSNSYSVSTGGDVEGAAAWVDYNQDGIFDASEMLFNSFAGTNPATYSGTFTVPATALNGATRMRVRCTYNTNPGNDGCTGGSTSFGETEDYTVNITGGQNSPSAMVLLYSWGPSGSVSPLTGLNTTFTGSTIGTTTVVLTITDSLTGCTNTVNTPINVNDVPAAPACEGDTICGQGSVTLTATAAGSGQLFWTDNIGGNILGIGNSLTKAVSTSGSDFVREFPANLDTTNIGYNPIANPSAAVGYFPTTAQGMWFRVSNSEGVILKSVDIIPNGPVGSAVTIAVIDSLGNTIGTVSTVTTVTNTSTASPFNYQTVVLDIFVPYSATPYAIRPVTNPNLAVHQNATVTATNPWLINGDIQILAYGNMPPAASYFGTNTFGFFYNWQVLHGCFGDACEAAYVANPAPALNITAGGSTTFCGSGSISLDAATASDPSYVNFSWTPAGGLSSTTGAVVTASVTSTTSYIVTANDGALCQNSDTITLTVNTAPFADAGTANDTICASTSITLNGNGGSASYKYVGTTENPGQTAGWPFNGANASQRMQVGVTAAELNAAGIFGPAYLNSIGFQVANKLSSQPYSNFTVSIVPVGTGLGCFTSATYDAVAPANIVYTGNVSTVLGWNDLVFQTPFYWDGSSDLVVNTCFTNTTNTFFDIVYTTQTPGCNSVRADNADACGDASGAMTEFRPNLRFQGGAVNYTWSPATELSASNIANPVFTSTLGTGPRTLYLTVTDPSSTCTAIDSVSFYVNNAPDAPVISFDGDTIVCSTGSVDLISVVFDGSFQWQSSADGINFTDIVGATNDSLTYAPTAPTYVRLKAFCVDSSYSNIKYIMVYNPTVSTVENDTVCGQGNVTLNATAPAGYFLQWFADSLSGVPLANTGNIGSYSAYITQTDTFWVRATIDTNAVFGGGSIPAGYCVTNLHNFASNCITNVTFNTLNYSSPSGTCALPSFDDVPESTATTQLTLGQTLNLTATWDAGAFGYLWIDWNRDGVFDASEFQTNGVTSAGHTFVVTVPVNAAPGKTKMRLRTRTVLVTGADACTNFGSGETEDFVITIGQDACSSAKVPVIGVVTPAPAVTITPSSAAICAGESLTMSDATGNYPGGYTWNPVSTISNAANGETTVTPSVTTSYILTGSDGSCTNSDTIVVTVNPLPVFTLNTTTPSVCGGDTAEVSVTVTSPVPTNYNVSPITYAPSTITGTAGPSGDDNVATAPIGFSFNFYGNTYTDVVISTNGFISFDLASGAGCCTGQVLPNTATPNNLVSLGWEDLTAAAGQITYATIGTAPNRVFVVNYNGVAHLSGAGTPLTGQIKLFEGTNVVEVHTTSYSDDGTATTQGVENSTGTLATAVAGRNGVAPWSATNDAYRFVMPMAATLQWSGSNIIGSTTASSIQAIPSSSGYYSVVVTDPATGCTKADSIFINAGGNPKPVISTNDTSVCAPTVIDVVVADTGVYSGGYPAGTTFEWFGLSGQIVPATPDLDTIPSIFGSSYFVTVTLLNGCTATSDTAYILTKAVAVVDTITNAACGSPGSIKATVTAGIPPFNYVWSTDLAQTNVIQTTSTSSTQDVLSNLAAGTYYLSVADEYGLPTSCNSGVLTYVVAGANPITVDSIGQTSVVCNGQADGTATVYYSGGVAPVSILWSTGGTSATIGGLAAGTYSVIVSDGGGCADTAQVTITEPAALSGVLSSTPESAPGALDGSVTAVISGGTTPYNIGWYDLIPNQVGVGATVTGLGAGFYQVFVEDANFCQYFDTVEVTVVNDVTLNLTMLIEGMYDGVSGLVPALLNSGVGLSATECDTIRVELRDQTSPTTVLASGTSVLNTSGQASFTFPGAVNGATGYIAVFHRNAVETWSDLVTFSAITPYDFTTAATQAYSGNQKEVATGVWAFYSGDLSPQDGLIDVTDQGLIDNDIFNFVSGYAVTDITGDGLVDVTDQGIVDNNIFNFVGSIHP